MTLITALPAPLPTVQDSRPPYTRLRAQTVQNIQHLLQNMKKQTSRHDKAVATIAVFNAVRAAGNVLLLDLSFASAVLEKCFEMRIEPEFNSCGLRIPAREWFDTIIVWVLETTGLRNLVATQHNHMVTFSILQEKLREPIFPIQIPRHAIKIAEGLAQHRIKFKVVASQLRFTQNSLEDLAYAAAYAALPKTPRPREVGDRCCVAWTKDNRYHPAKIVWISRSRRLCKFVYAGWVSGWETEQHYISLSCVVDYDRVGGIAAVGFDPTTSWL